MSLHYKLNILKSGYITNILARFSKTVSKPLEVHKLNQIQINIVKEYTENTNHKNSFCCQRVSFEIIPFYGKIKRFIFVIYFSKIPLKSKRIVLYQKKFYLTFGCCASLSW